MDNARYDAGELRNNSQGAERAAQIGAMGRIADELFDSGALQAMKNASQSKLPGEAEANKWFSADKGKSEDLDGGIKGESAEDFDGDEDLNGDNEDGREEDFDGDEDLHGDNEDGREEDFDGEEDFYGDEDFYGGNEDGADAKKGKGKYAKDGTKLDENGRDLQGAVREGNQGGELKSSLHGEVGEGPQGGELKNNFNDRNSQVQGDRENGRDLKAGNATWPKTFKNNDARLPQHLDFSNPYPTLTA